MSRKLEVYMKDDIVFIKFKCLNGKCLSNKRNIIDIYIGKFHFRICEHVASFYNMDLITSFNQSVTTHLNRTPLSRIELLNLLSEVNSHGVRYPHTIKCDDYIKALLQLAIYQE